MAIEVTIPGIGLLRLEEAVFDYNGTLADGGQMSEALVVLVGELKAQLTVVILSAGTFGGLEEAAGRLGVGLQRVETGADKAAYVGGRVGVVAIGNGRNDALMFQEAALAICILGPEGAASEALAAADLVVRSPEDAIRLLLDPRRLIATLRR